MNKTWRVPPRHLTFGMLGRELIDKLLCFDAEDDFLFDTSFEHEGHKLKATLCSSLSEPNRFLQVEHFKLYK